MTSFMGIGPAAALLLLGLEMLVLPAAGALAASPTDCASVGMDFADAVATKKCESGDAGDAQCAGRNRS